MKTTMKLCAVFLGALGAYAQTVSLSDTLTNAVGGGSFAGRVTVTLNAPGNASPLYYSTTSLTGWQAVYCLGVTGADCTTTTAAGTFAATLYANSTITPAGTSYSARFQPTKGSPWSETWTVEASDTKLYQVRSTTVPTPTVTFQPSQLALSAGSLIYGSSAGVGTALAAGTNGYVLTLSGGYPAWAAAAGGGVTSLTGTANQITASAATGAVTLSIPTNPTLPGTTTGTFSGNLTGNASTATALAANPTDCSAGQYANAIAASGNLTCATVAYADVSGTPTLTGYVSGAGALTTTGAVPYVTASGVLAQDGSLLRTATGKYTLYDQTATTGDTKWVVRSGAGQSSNLQEWQNNSGSVVAYVNGSGLANAPGYQLNSDAYISAAVAYLKNNYVIGWSSDGTYFGAFDAGLARNTAGVVEVNNGTAGTLRDFIARQYKNAPVAVSSLQTCNSGNAGSVASVSDSLAPAWGVTVANGGAAYALVTCNGANWTVIGI